MAEEAGEHIPADAAADTPGVTEQDPLAALDGIEDVPLEQQVEVFQAIHDHLAERLDEAES